MAAAIDQGGLIYWEHINDKYDADRYIQFLKNLSKHVNPKQRHAIFYDGFSVHCVKECIEFLICKLNWLPC